MDNATLRHLEAWLAANIERQSDDEQELIVLRDRMVKLYETDPDCWGNRSWWQAYDQVCLTLGQ